MRARPRRRADRPVDPAGGSAACRPVPVFVPAGHTPYDRVMQVFVLSTGRCGSLTTARAFRHATNYTSGHETRTSLVGPARFEYPDQHIESDNRLCWFLGTMQERFPDAFYVHLVRDPEQVSESHAAKWVARDRVHQPFAWDLRRPRTTWRRLQRRLERPADAPLTLARAFGLGIARNREGPTVNARFMVETVTANIGAFLRDKHWLPLRLERSAVDFPPIWDRIGAIGDLEDALAEFDVRHNARQLHQEVPQV